MICNFEEVYQNGDMQQGHLLIKENKIRYQYNDNNLYTILRTQGDFYLIENIYPDKFMKIDQNTEALIGIEMIINDLLLTHLIISWIRLEGGAGLSKNLSTILESITLCQNCPSSNVPFSFL